MKERIFIIIDNDETYPEDAIVAVVNNHAEAIKTIHQTPTRNLTICEQNVYGSFDELKNDLES